MARSRILFFLKIKLNDILGHFGAKIPNQPFGPLLMLCVHYNDSVIDFLYLKQSHKLDQHLLKIVNLFLGQNNFLKKSTQLSFRGIFVSVQYTKLSLS